MGLYGLLVICGSDGLEDERVGFIGFGAGLWWVVVVVFMKEGLGDIGLLTVSEGERKNRFFWGRRITTQGLERVLVVWVWFGEEEGTVGTGNQWCWEAVAGECESWCSWWRVCVDESKIVSPLIFFVLVCFFFFFCCVVGFWKGAKARIVGIWKTHSLAKFWGFDTKNLFFCWIIDCRQSIRLEFWDWGAVNRRLESWLECWGLQLKIWN